MDKETIQGTKIDSKTEKEVYAGNILEAEISNKEAKSKNNNMAAHNNYTAEIKDNEIAQSEENVEKEKNGFFKVLIKAFEKQPTALKVFEISAFTIGMLGLGNMVKNTINTYIDHTVKTPGIKLDINKDDAKKDEDKKVVDNGEISNDSNNQNNKTSGNSKTNSKSHDEVIEEIKEKDAELENGRINTINENKSKEDKNKIQYEKPAEDPAITGTENDKQFEDGIRGSDASTETNKDTPASVKEAPNETPPEAPQEVDSFEDRQNDTKTEPKTDTKVVNDQEWTFDDL